MENLLNSLGGSLRHTAEKYASQKPGGQGIEARGEGDVSRNLIYPWLATGIIDDHRQGGKGK